MRAAQLALAKGMKVRGLQRSADKAKTAQALGAEVIVGSVTDAAVVHKACQGVDVVLHTAAIAKEGGSIAQFRHVNVGGTINLAKAAKKAGVKAFVHLSSVMVYGFHYPNGVTEAGPLKGDNNPYCQTKVEAEQALLKFKLNSAPDFNPIIIRPGDVYGPGSRIWIVRPLILMHKKRFVLPNGGQGVINHVYIDNLIDAIFLAIEKEAYGEAFNITDGQETSWKEYFTRLAKIGGISPPFSLPANVLKFLIRLRCLKQTVLGQEVDLFPQSIDFLCRPYAYSITKAQRLLGYTPKIELEEGMRRTQQWLQTTDLQKLLQHS